MVVKIGLTIAFAFFYVGCLASKVEIASLKRELQQAKTELKQTKIAAVTVLETQIENNELSKRNSELRKQNNQLNGMLVEARSRLDEYDKLASKE